MAGDTLQLNTKAKQQHTYDAIVIGSGVSGGWAAKELCEKGLTVLMLERGKPLKHGDYPTANMAPWEFPHRITLSKADKEEHKVQSRHFSYREDNKAYYINDAQNPYDEISRFDWVRGDIVGGRSLLWGRACYRWSDLEFEANLKDGHGVDWPIRYKDIAPWYSYVEKFVGVSGNRDGIPHLPDGEFLPPFDMNCVEKDFKARVEKKFTDRKVIIGRAANLTQAVGGRGPCQARDLCHRGCPWGGYFSSNSATIPAAEATGKFTLRPNSLVNRILYDEKTQKASGVEVIDTETKAVTEYYATIIFVNAATVATTAILLNSVSNRFPNGMGNGSDQLGRNLMDHHKGVAVAAAVEGFEDSYYSGRRPIPLYMPRFRNITEQSPDFIRGYHFGASAGRSRPEPATTIGANYKDALTEAGPWHITVYAYGECLPYAENRVTLNRDKKDPWGRPMITIDCKFRDNELAMHKDMIATAKDMLEQTGYKEVRVAAEAISAPGNANHEMGTARMGKDPKTSVLNAFNQLHEVPNVFVTDGSCMTSSSYLNPSITYMALTARACDYALKELKKGNL